MNCYCCSGPAKKFGRFQNKNRIVQRYRCNTCGKTSSEDQPLDHLRVSHDKVIQIVKLLTEGLGIRAVSRLTGCHTHTVLDVFKVVGQKCDNLHDKLSRNVKTGSLQLDEVWSYVERKQIRCAPGDTDRGDQYTYLAVTAREKFNHKAAISLFVAVFNFCKVHGTLGTTPAHGIGITDGPWSIERLIDEAVQC